MSEHTININAKYVKGETQLHFMKYANGSIAIQGLSLYGEPMFIATVALDELPPKGHVFLKGWSENEGIPESLENAGIVKLTGRKIPTGYCEEWWNLDVEHAIVNTFGTLDLEKLSSLIEIEKTFLEKLFKDPINTKVNAKALV